MTYFRRNGIIGLYKGIVCSSIGIFIYKGCYFGFYDIGKSMITKSDQPLADKAKKFVIANLATTSA